MTEYKVPIDAFNGYNSKKLHTQMVIRLATTRIGDRDTIYQLACDLLLQYMNYYFNVRGLAQNTKNLEQVAALKESEIIYYRDQVLEENGQTYYYHQFVVGADVVRNIYNCSLVDTLRQMRPGGGIIRNTVASPSIPADVLALQVGDIMLDGRNDMICITPPILDPALFFKIYSIKNNIAMRTIVKPNKVYTNNSLTKIGVEWYHNLVDAMNAHDNTTYFITSADAITHTFFACQLGANGHGGYAFHLTYSNKVYADICNDTLVIYDGKASFLATKPYIEHWVQKVDISVIVITQFSKNKDLFYTGYSSSILKELNKMILHYVSAERIEIDRAYFSTRSNGLNIEGSVSCKIPAHREKRLCYNVALNNPRTGYYMDLVIPYTKEGHHLTALQWISDVMDMQVAADVDIGRLRQLISLYPELLRTEQNVTTGDDVLSAWFQSCIKTSKHADDQVVTAYKNMKASLEKEYKDLGAYVSHFDFSKCMAIPKIKIDEKLKINYYKSLHVEPKNVIINTVNNQKIQNIINTVQPTIRFMTKVHSVQNKGELILIGEYPVKKFYDAKTNVINLEYDVLKGEVIRDKVKNRR
jgi:hypothetical protein